MECGFTPRWSSCPAPPELEENKSWLPSALDADGNPVLCFQS
jgi:hypothetical protein